MDSSINPHIHQSMCDFNKRDAGNKPDSVHGNARASPPATICLCDQYPEFKRCVQQHHPLFGLAPEGVCHAILPLGRTRWALTPPFHPYSPLQGGGMFSVALSFPRNIVRSIPRRLRARDFPHCGVRTFLPNRTLRPGWSGCHPTSLL